MTSLDIAYQRLHNQRILTANANTPAEVVSWLGAVQAQDYLGAQWALGMRMQGATDATIEQAMTDGAILRTHVMRPTWHFVAPEDIRWLLALTAPRVHTASGFGYRAMGLDDAAFKRSEDALAKALQGGKQMTRDELIDMFAQVGIVTKDVHLVHLLMHAELAGRICSGPRRGKQFTYMLLDERVPPMPHLERDEALLNLTKRYFTSHGPATVQDFVWWSGLTVADAKRGLQMAKADLVEQVIDGTTYWMSPTLPLVQPESSSVHLLSGFDEYLVSYRDRSASLAGEHQKLWDRGNAIFSSVIVIGGKVVGMWKRTVTKKAVTIATTRFQEFTPTQEQAYTAAVQRYGAFLGLPIIMI
jgi:hypothetical protein